MDVFLPEYNVLGVPLVGKIYRTRGRASLEKDAYGAIKRAAEKLGWLYNRIETASMDGMPDIFVSRGHEYAYIEVKRLKLQRLRVIEDQLDWQYGQLAFMKRCSRNGSHYLLMVVKGHEVAVYKEQTDERIEAWNYPDFIR